MPLRPETKKAPAISRTPCPRWVEDPRQRSQPVQRQRIDSRTAVSQRTPPKVPDGTRSNQQAARATVVASGASSQLRLFTPAAYCMTEKRKTQSAPTWVAMATRRNSGTLVTARPISATEDKVNNSQPVSQRRK